METCIINGAFNLITLIGVLLIVRFTKGFGDQKGKNLADKQDIKQLTQLVEEVKTDFDKDLKRFESQLKLTADLRFSHLAEARKSIIDFYDTCNKWVAKALSLSTDKVKLLSPDELRRASVSLEKVDEAYLSLSNMELLNNDERLISLGLKLMEDIVKYSDFVREKVDRIESEKSYIAFEKSKILALSEDDPAYQAQVSAYAMIEMSGSKIVKSVLAELSSESKRLRNICADSSRDFITYAKPILSAN